MMTEQLVEDAQPNFIVIITSDHRQGDSNVAVGGHCAPMMTNSVIQLVGIWPMPALF